MFLLKGLMAHYLFLITNLAPTGDLCIFGIEYGIGRTFLEQTLKNTVWFHQNDNSRFSG